MAKVPSGRNAPGELAAQHRSAPHGDALDLMVERKGSAQAAPLGEKIPVSGKAHLKPNSSAVEKSQVLGLHLALATVTCLLKRQDFDSYWAQFSKAWAHVDKVRARRSWRSGAADRGNAIAAKIFRLIDRSGLLFVV